MRQTHINDSEGIIKSEVFSGLWLDREASLAANLACDEGIITSKICSVDFP